MKEKLEEILEATHLFWWLLLAAVLILGIYLTTLR